MIETTENNSEYTYAEQLKKLAVRKCALGKEWNSMQRSHEQDDVPTKE